MAEPGPRRHSTLKRAFLIMTVMGRVPLTTRQVWEDVGKQWCLRTIRRDLDAMCEAGLVLKTLRQGEQHYVALVHIEDRTNFSDDSIDLFNDADAASGDDDR